MQVLSDLHLEFADGYRPRPAPGADLLVAAGDLGHTPESVLQLAGWPVPVLFVPGNHEYDGSELDDADEELRDLAVRAGVILLNLGEHLVTDPVDGRRIRFVGCSRWWDFDLLGPHRRDECMQAAARYLRHMGSAWKGRPLTPEGVRELAVAHRAWLAERLRAPFDGVTVAITHSGPSARSADPRFGLVPGTAAFCNADDDLIELADLWIHGHLHARHDYRVGRTRVVCNPRGYERLGEHGSYDPALVVEV